MADHHNVSGRPPLKVSKLRALVALVVPAMLLLPLMPSATADEVQPRKATASKTIKLKTIPKSAEEIANPLRGQYRWMGYGMQPEAWPGNDVYYRDQVYWGRIEPADNAFDFSFIENGLADAEARGGTFNLRVMAYCPGCWMNYRDDWAPVTPSFIPLNAAGAPEWNSEAFVGQWEELMAELGRRYGSNPRIGIVDVGGYGKYGEYWTDGAEGKISVANSQRLVGAVVKAFPRAHVVLNTMDPSLVLPAVKKYKKLGLRTDCLGAFNMFSIIPLYPELQDVWKRAPIISEWCHSSDASTTEGAKQVRKYHVSMVSSQNFYTPYAEMSPSQQKGWTSAAKDAGYRYSISSLTLPKSLKAGGKNRIASKWTNGGSAPTYDKWTPTLGLQDSSGALVWSGKWRVPLPKIYPGSKKISSTVKLPKLKAGKYSLVVTVKSSRAGFAPMNLANAGSDGTGWYRLAGVKVK